MNDFQTRERKLKRLGSAYGITVMAKLGFCFAAIVALILAAAPVSSQGPSIPVIPPEEKRLALLIGNASYSKGAGALKNSVNDVKIIGAVLSRLGFDVVIKQDLELVPLRRAVSEYAKRLKEAGDNTVGFFYYSGHGAAEKDSGPNYLIPVDADLNLDEIGVASENLESIVDTLSEAGTGSVIQFVMFDACRVALRRGTRGGIRGFVPARQRAGMVIVFSTREGETAFDEYPDGSPNGPFATKLAESLENSAQREDIVIYDLQRAVADYTGGRQQPHTLRSPVRDFFFNKRAAASATVPLAKQINPKPVITANAIDQLQSLIGNYSLVPTERDELQTVLGKVKSRGAKHQQFTYYGPGDLLPGTGIGAKDFDVYAPDIVFPIDNAEAFVNSQVYGYGGALARGEIDLGASTLDPRNYSYPWRDNFCEPRAFSLSACPSGKGHQGIDIRAGTFDPGLRAIVPQKGTNGGRVRVVAVEDGVITVTSALRLASSDGQRFWRYLNLCPDDIVVKAGQPVKSGDLLGYLGNCVGETRGLTTYHLHLDLSLKDGAGTRFVSPYMTLVRAYERRFGIGSMISD
jgi:murein DD-endopeptidase MepM/ murein hydrolase activator NlpD